MMSTARYPEAAYAFLRYITISTDGWLSRMYRDQNPVRIDEVTGETYMATPGFQVPTNTGPIVQAAFRDIDVLEGFRYQYENMNNVRTWSGDPQKIIPNWWYILQPFRDARDRIWDGETNPHAVAAELDQLVNANLEYHMSAFQEIMVRVQADFEANR